MADIRALDRKALARLTTMLLFVVLASSRLDWCWNSGRDLGEDRDPDRSQLATLFPAVAVAALAMTLPADEAIEKSVSGRRAPADTRSAVFSCTSGPPTSIDLPAAVDRRAGARAPAVDRRGWLRQCASHGRAHLVAMMLLKLGMITRTRTSQCRATRGNVRRRGRGQPGRATFPDVLHRRSLLSLGADYVTPRRADLVAQLAPTSAWYFSPGGAIASAARSNPVADVVPGSAQPGCCCR